MNKRRKRVRAKPGSPLWMSSFSDMVTLILVFFIILFSMSVIDAEKFKAIADSFQDSGGFDGMPSIVPFENPAEDSELRDDPFEQGADPFEDHVVKELDDDEISEQLDQLLLEVLNYLDEND